MSTLKSLKRKLAESAETCVKLSITLSDLSTLMSAMVAFYIGYFAALCDIIFYLYSYSIASDYQPRSYVMPVVDFVM